MARHRRFALEFKRLVVLDFLEKRLGLRELSRKHNLSRNLLSQWVRKYETGPLTDQIADARCIAEDGGKIAELKRKVGQLTMEIDLLKKGCS
jgi:transposase